MGDTAVKYPDIHVQLIGQDGNAFSIIGRVASAIRRKHGAEAASTFTNEAMTNESYDDLLAYISRTVDTY